MQNTYWKAACLGIVSGMRSMAGPALFSEYVSRDPSETLRELSLGWLGTPRAAQVTKVLAAGEIVGDKLPLTPSRLDPGPLFGRIVSGGLSGGAICAAEGVPLERGAAIGALAAVAGATLFYHLRRQTVQATGLPDPIIAIGEDALVYGGGWYALTG